MLEFYLSHTVSAGIGAFYGNTDEKAAYEALTYSADRGMTFWDCADIYGTSTFAFSHPTLSLSSHLHLHFDFRT